MWSFTLSSHEISKLVWRRLLSEHAIEIESVKQALIEANRRLERDRHAMAYQTYPISFASAVILYLVVRKISPARVFEIGTFIGRSTVAMVMAMDRSEGADQLLLTCDSSNDFVMDTSHFKTPIKAMPRMGSTDALKATRDLGRPIDFFHIDGRLQDEDLSLIAALSHDRTVFALDDFEGTEKGVINAIKLRQSPKFSRYFLIEPPSEQVMAGVGLGDRCITALLVPAGVFQLSQQ